MERSESSISASKNLFLFALTPITRLYKWVYPTSPENNLIKDAPYLVSASWFCFGFNYIRAFIWNDSLTYRGYKQYREGMFKMPFFGQWMTVVGPKYIDEIARAPESSLSFQQNFNYQLQLEQLVGPVLSKDQIHLILIRTLNRNLDGIYTEIADETGFAVIEELANGKKTDCAGIEWISVSGFQFIDNIISRLNYRAFVGLPQCRDKKWSRAMDKDTFDVAVRTVILRMFPESKLATVNWCLGLFGKPFGATVDIMTTTANERLSLPVEERSNNLLTWILDRVPGEEPDPRVICGIFQLIRNVAQGTTSMSFAHALFHLVVHPEYIDILCADITEAMEDGELTHNSLGRMHKLDSFLRETQRLSVISNFSLGRVAMKDFYFSNGVCVQEGEMVQTAAAPLHHDASLYPEPLEFKPWRYYDLRIAKKREDGTGAAASEYDMVTPSNTFLTWGLGRHACPGRWYAAMVMKHLMAYLLLNYDVKLPDSAKGRRPDDINVGSIHIPNISTHVLFKPRISE